MQAGRLVDRLVVGALVQIAARTDPAAETLRLDFPDGSTVAGDVRLGDPIETALHGRTAVGHVVIGPWAEALEPIAGRRVRVVRTDHPGGTRSGNPTSLVSRGSLAELARHAGVDEIDARRFRMLIELDGVAAHAEDRLARRPDRHRRRDPPGHGSRCPLRDHDAGPGLGCP